MEVKQNNQIKRKIILNKIIVKFFLNLKGKKENFLEKMLINNHITHQ